MIVFKGYMKIALKNIGSLILYLVIFLSVTIGVQGFSKDQKAEEFSSVKLKMAVVDEDGGPAARLLYDYLKEKHHVKDISNDDETLKEEMYYGNIEYILRIPKDFEEKCIIGGEKLKVTVKPGTYSGLYADQQINSFLNKIKTYRSSGYTIEEIKDTIFKGDIAQVKILDDDGKDQPVYSFMFQYLPYLLLASLCYTLSLILASFKDRDIRNRMLSSAISSKRQTLEAFLAFCVIGTCVWFLSSVIVPIVLYGTEFLQDPFILYYLFNSFILMIVCLTIAFLVGILVNGVTAITGIVNVVSLGMCFLCGVFVPLSLLGSGVKKVSQFLPVYWYEVINNSLSESGSTFESIKGTLAKGYIIQILFAVACICVALAISKRKRQMS